MMNNKNKESFEKKIKSGDGKLPPRMNVSILKYYWQASLFHRRQKDNIPNFLRNVDMLHNFSENERRIFANYLHMRTFEEGEVVFDCKDRGVALYLVLSGKIGLDGGGPNNILYFEKYDYFGELALLQENSFRNATAIAQNSSVLLGLFKPDIEEMVNNDSAVAARFLHSISMILADRLSSVMMKLGQFSEKEGKK